MAETENIPNTSDRTEKAPVAVENDAFVGAALDASSQSGNDIIKGIQNNKSEYNNNPGVMGNLEITGLETKTEHPNKSPEDRSKSHGNQKKDVADSSLENGVYGPVTISGDGADKQVVINNANATEPTVLSQEQLKSAKFDPATETLTYKNAEGNEVSVDKSGKEVTKFDPPNEKGNTSVTRDQPGGRITEATYKNGANVKVDQDGSFTYNLGLYEFRYDNSAGTFQRTAPGTGEKVDWVFDANIDNNGNIHFIQETFVGFNQSKRVEDNGHVVDDESGGYRKYDNWDK